MQFEDDVLCGGLNSTVLFYFAFTTNCEKDKEKIDVVEKSTHHLYYYQRPDWKT